MANTVLDKANKATLAVVDHKISNLERSILDKFLSLFSSVEDWEDEQWRIARKMAAQVEIVVELRGELDEMFATLAVPDPKPARRTNGTRKRNGRKTAA